MISWLCKLWYKLDRFCYPRIPGAKDPGEAYGAALFINGRLATKREIEHWAWLRQQAELRAQVRQRRYNRCIERLKR